MRLRPFPSFAALALFASAGVLVPFLPADEKDGPPGLLSALKGHKEAVYGVAFSPDGRFVLTASGDPAVKVWDALTGKEVKSFSGPNAHKQLVLAVSVSPDGTQFATCGSDNTAKVWDFPTSKHLREFAQGVPARAVAASADGKQLAAGGKDGKVKVWNTTDGKLLREFEAHKGSVTGLAFSPNGQVLVSGSSDTTVRFTNTPDGKSLAHFAAHAGAVTGVTWNPAGNVVYTTGADGTLKFWTLPPVATRHLANPLMAPVSALALSPDGAQIVAASGKGVRLATLANGQTVKDLVGAPEAPTCVAASPGSAFVAGAAGRRVVLWQTKTGEVVVQPVAHGGGVTGLAFNPPGTQMATVGKDGVLRLWAVPPTPARSLTQTDAVRAAVLSADGKRLATGGADKVVRLYTLDNLKMPERQLSGHTAAVNAVAIRPDGKMLASAGDDEVIRFWDLAKGEQVAQIGAHTGPVSTLVFGAGGAQVLSSSADGTLKVFAAPAPGAKGVFSHAGEVVAAALSPDGARLLTGCSDKQARLWNLTTGQVERGYAGPTLGILCVAYSPLGTHVAAGSADKSLTVWEAASNKEVRKLANLPAAVHSTSLSPDGRHVAAGLADGSVRLFELATGKEVSSFAAHKGAVNALLFTAKGDQLISGGADGLVQARVVTPKAGAVTEWKHGAGVLSLALSKDGARVAVGGADKRIKVRTLATGKDEPAVATPAEVRGLTFSSDGKRLAAGGGDGKARIYGADGQLDEYFAHDGAVHAVAWSADGKKLFTASADKSARSFPPGLVWRGKHDGAVREAVYTSRGVVSAGADGLVRLWNAADGKPLQAIRAHTAGVLALSPSADGARLATVGADKTARLWEFAKLPAGKTGGKELDKPSGTATLPAAPSSVGLSPNGLRLAVGFPGMKKEKETVRVYDAASGKELLDLGAVDGLPSRVVSFLPDNRTLLAAGADRTARLIDVNIQAALDVHPGGAAGVAYHQNGTQILTGGADKTVKLWTPATGKLDRTFGPTAAAVTAVTFSRDFTWVAALAGRTLTAWTVNDGKEVLSIEQPEAGGSLSFSSDRTRIAVGGSDGRARVWDVATKKEAQAFLHAGAVAGVAFHPFTNTQLVTGGADKSVGVHTLTVARVVATGKVQNGLTASPSHVLTAGEDGKVTFWNPGTGVAEKTFPAGQKAAACVAVARNQQLVAVGSADKKVRLFAYNQPKELSAFTAASAPRALAFSPDNQALVAALADGGVAAWNVVYTVGQPLPAEFGKVVQGYSHAPEASSVTFPGAGAIFYTAGADKTAKAWKLASDSPTRNFAHPNSVNAVAFNQDGTRLVTGCSDGRVRIFDLVKGTLLKEILAHPTMNLQAIYCVAFSPDGKEVVSGSIDQTLKLWDASGKLVREFKAYKEKVFEKGHQEAVLSVAFSPDGKSIASGSMDRTIKIWNVADGSVAREFVNPDLKPAPGQPAPSHPGWVYAVRYFDGGKKIVSAGGAPRLRGYLATWDAATGKRLFGKEMGIGTLFAAAASADDGRLALGTGGSVRSGAEFNQALVLKMPK
jgi:WD40 repeat protein